MSRSTQAACVDLKFIYSLDQTPPAVSLHEVCIVSDRPGKPCFVPLRCGSKHPHSIVFGTVSGQFTVTQTAVTMASWVGGDTIASDLDRQ